MEDAGGGRCHVLVVEDNAADVELFRWALVDAGLDCELTVIDDGREALDFVLQRGRHSAARLPDLAILDWNLPKNDGLEILEGLRANRAFDDVPIVILSSASSPRDRAKMEAFGIARYITKPPDLEEYLRIGLVVKELLGSSKSDES